MRKWLLRQLAAQRMYRELLYTRDFLSSWGHRWPPLSETDAAMVRGRADGITRTLNAAEGRDG